MISKSLLKEIIQENQKYILNEITGNIPREHIVVPEILKKVVVFYGVRRSGKTFILYDIYRRNKDTSLYVDFEDERLTDFNVKDFETLKSAFFELNPHLIDKGAIFLLDEVQNIDGWEKFCRRTAEREKVRVFVSGSSSKLLSKELNTVLRGRSWGIEVFPFSFREYLVAVKCDLDNKFKMKIELDNFLRWGGFPEVVTLSFNYEKSKVLKEYLEAMFFKDLVERNNVSNIQLLNTLMDSILSSPSLKFSNLAFYRQYKNKFSFSKDLLYEYYKYFLESMLIHETRKDSPSSYKRMRNPPKIYLVDTGLAKRITSEDSGRLLENAVFTDFRRRGCSLFYFDDEVECDFIVKDKSDNVSAVQVCYELNEHSKSRELDGLLRTCKFLGLKDGLIVSHDTADEFDMAGVKISVVPFWKWCMDDIPTPK